MLSSGLKLHTEYTGSEFNEAYRGIRQTKEICKLATQQNEFAIQYVEKEKSINMVNEFFTKAGFDEEMKTYFLTYMAKLFRENSDADIIKMCKDNAFYKT